jgi:acetoin utilization deacetylase AcuC-like enzyme
VQSIHGHPNYAYPYFSGFADERGDGFGRGYNRNYPLPESVDDKGYLNVLQEVFKQIREFKPAWLVVSLGFDIMRGDPTGAFVLTPQGMRQIGQQLGRLGLPTLVVQEGGYTIQNLRRGARAFFHGLGSTWY